MISHLMGAILAVPAVFFLVRTPLLEGDLVKASSLMVYGMALALVFVTSTLFHVTQGKTKAFYRHCDRIAIFLLIGGTYTPLMLLKLPPIWGRSILATIWAMVALAAVLETRPEQQKHRDSVDLFFLMGWMALPTMLPLLKTLTVPGVAWLMAGAFAFTLGGVALRWKLIPWCHEIWHVAVLAGSACHYAVMLIYVR